jgi:hypothetical protein
MARPCSVCSHPEAFLVNEVLIIEGRSNRAVARQFGLHHDAIRRHREHIPGLLLEAHEAEQASDADALLAEVRQVRDDLRRLCQKAEESEDYRTAIGGQATLLRYYDLLATVRKLIDERPQVNQVNVIVAPHVQQVIVEALQPYPEAGWAVSDALGKLEPGENS